MDGIYFLYTNWILWVLVFFFMPKTKRTTYIGLFLLTWIVSSSYHVHVGAISINSSIFLMIIGSIVIIAKNGKQIRITFMALSLCIGYAGALMWEMVSPVWILAPRFMIYSVLSFLVIFLVSNDFWTRIAVWTLGSAVGEVIFSFILLDMGFYEQAGDAAYLDIVSIVILMLVVSNAGSTFLKWLEQTITASVKRKAGIKS